MHTYKEKLKSNDDIQQVQHFTNLQTKIIVSYHFKRGTGPQTLLANRLKFFNSKI